MNSKQKRKIRREWLKEYGENLSKLFEFISEAEILIDKKYVNNVIDIRTGEVYSVNGIEFSKYDNRYYYTRHDLKNLLEKLNAREQT